MTYVLIKALAPIFLILFLGFWAGKTRLADNGNVSLLNIFLMDFALPVSLFLSTLQTPWSGIKRQAPLILILVLSMWTTYAITYLLARKSWGKDAPDSAVLSLTTALPNYAALGLPILTGVFGEGPGTALPVAVAISCGATLITPLCLASLEAGKRSNTGASPEKFLLPGLIAASFRKPIVFAPLVGAALSFALGFLGADVPELALVAFKPLGSAASGTALFLTGLILSARSARTSVSVVLASILKNVVMPFIALFFAFALGVDARTARTAVLLSALSAGFFGVLFGNRYGVRSPDAEGTLLASTIAFAITIPFFIQMTAE